MTKDQFTQLFQYMQSMKQDMDDRFNKVDERFTDVYGILANLLAVNRDFRDEMALIKRDQSRHDRWIHQLADKTQTELSID